MSIWKKIGSKIVFDHPRLRLAEDHVIMQDGQETNYLVLLDYPDHPLVIATREDGKILVTREHAYPINEYLWQFPEGNMDPGEEPEAAAARELAEETGYTAKNFRKIGDNLHWHRRDTARSLIYIATDAYELKDKPAADIEEQGIEVHWLDESEIWDMIVSGKIIQKNALAAWATYQAYLRSL